MANSIQMSKVDINFVRECGDILIKSANTKSSAKKSSTKKSATIGVIKEINKLHFSDDKPLEDYHNKILIIKEINKYLCDYYSGNIQQIEDIINHECIDCIQTMYSIINTYYYGKNAN